MTKKGVIPEWFYQESKLFKGKNLWMPDKSAQAWWEKESEDESTIKERCPLITPKRQKDKKKKIKNNAGEKALWLEEGCPGVGVL